MPAWQPTPSDTDTHPPCDPQLSSLIPPLFTPCDLAHVTEVSDYERHSMGQGWKGVMITQD